LPAPFPDHHYLLPISAHDIDWVIIKDMAHVQLEWIDVPPTQLVMCQ